MKTIEIKQTDIEKNKRLIQKLVKLLPDGAYYHFFYEPQLIIRVHDINIGVVTRALHSLRLQYEIYPYPFPPKGGDWGTNSQYGEDKKSVTYKYNDDWLRLLNTNSRLAIAVKPKDRIQVIVRHHHLFLNTFGFEWADEAIINSAVARGNVRTIRQYDSPSLIAKMYCSLIIFLITTNIHLMKLLK